MKKSVAGMIGKILGLRLVRGWFLPVAHSAASPKKQKMKHTAAGGNRKQEPGTFIYLEITFRCCYTWSSLPLERFFHEENYFCPILVQPLQEEEQRPLKTRNRSAQNVRSQLPKTVSLFSNRVTPSMENEIENKWLVVEFTSFGEVLSRGELFLLDRLVQPLQEEEQRPLKTEIPDAVNVSRLPSVFSFPLISIF